MDCYKSLNKQVFHKENYKIIPIRFKDRINIMKWRNEQIYHLRQSKLLTLKDQDEYFNKKISLEFGKEKPNQILFSYLKDDKCIGYGGLVHINWNDGKAEISFIMKTSLEHTEFDSHWTTFLTLIKKVAFDELNLMSIYTYAYDLRPLLYPTLEKNGFNLKTHLKDEIEIENKKIDVFIHELINPISLFKIREVTESDTKLIFKWSNDPMVRLQSFNSNSIDFINHQNWFKEKIKNNNSLLLINKFKSNNIGLVRFELENDKCTVGILIDKKFRGKGFSSLMLIESSAYYFNRFSIPIIAYIKESNTASIRSFEGAGYKFFKKKIINGIKSVVYKLEKI